MWFGDSGADKKVEQFRGEAEMVWTCAEGSGYTGQRMIKMKLPSRRKISDEFMDEGGHAEAWRDRAGIGGDNQLWCPLKAAAAGSFMLSPADLTAVGILSSDSVRTQKIKVS